jgi:3alpha(or 20beta)-hydroxysteroid dehydrogenase
MSDPFGLVGKTAIITGGARGQGAEEARLFVDLGAQVVVADVLDEEGEALAVELGAAATYCHLDVADEQGWETVVKTAADIGEGAVDVLVNNAGVVRPAKLVDTTLDEFMWHVNVNQLGVFLGMRATAPHMRNGSSIVNVSSAAALAGVSGLGAYSASKWAVRGLTKVAAMELGSAGIRVNTVLPGGVDTPMVRSTGLDDETIAKQWATLVPLGRIGQPQDIAWMVAFLASDHSTFCTGGDFVVDGGRTVGVTSPLASGT